MNVLRCRADRSRHCPWPPFKYASWPPFKYTSCPPFTYTLWPPFKYYDYPLNTHHCRTCNTLTEPSPWQDVGTSFLLVSPHQFSLAFSKKSLKKLWKKTLSHDNRCLTERHIGYDTTILKLQHCDNNLIWLFHATTNNLFYNP